MKTNLPKWSSKLLYLLIAYIIFLLIKHFLIAPGKPKDNGWGFVNYVDSSKLQEQSTPTEIFDSGNCYVSTKGIDNALGVDMSLYYPCDWGRYNNNPNKQSFVEQYGYNVSDSLTVGFSLEIGKRNKVLNNDDIDKVNSKEFLTEMMHNEGDFISSSILYINGYKTIEVILKESRTDACIYHLNYLFFINNKSIFINYIFGSQKIESAKEDFYNNYILLFRSLARKTKIISL